MARTTHSVEHPSDSLYTCAAATSYGSTAGFSWDVGSRKSASENGQLPFLRDWSSSALLICILEDFSSNQSCVKFCLCIMIYKYHVTCL